MTLLEAPLWIQVLVVAEASAVAWLTWRFAWRGLGWGLLGALVFWLVLGFSASFLVSRLEGGGATPLSDLLAGAVVGTVRAGLIALPLTAGGALLGGLLRRVIRPRPGAA